MTSIGGKAFYGSGLTGHFAWPAGCNEILQGTFYGCAALTSISGLGAAGVTSIEREAFQNSGLAGSFTWPPG